MTRWEFTAELFSSEGPRMMTVMPIPKQLARRELFHELSPMLTSHTKLLGQIVPKSPILEPVAMPHPTNQANQAAGSFSPWR